MNDTSPDMDARYRAMLMQRSGEERLIMGCAMRDTARALVEASLREHDTGTGHLDENGKLIVEYDMKGSRYRQTLFRR